MKIKVPGGQGRHLELEYHDIQAKDEDIFLQSQSKVGEKTSKGGSIMGKTQ